MDYIRVNNELYPLRNVKRVKTDAKIVIIEYEDATESHIKCKDKKHATQVMDELCFFIGNNNKIINVDEIVQLTASQIIQKDLFADLDDENGGTNP